MHHRVRFFFVGGGRIFTYRRVSWTSRTWTSRERAGRAEKKTRRSRDRTVSKGKGRRAPSYRAYTGRGDDERGPRRTRSAPLEHLSSTLPSPESKKNVRRDSDLNQSPSLQPLLEYPEAELVGPLAQPRDDREPETAAVKNKPRRGRSRAFQLSATNKQHVCLSTRGSQCLSIRVPQRHRVG